MSEHDDEDQWEYADEAQWAVLREFDERKPWEPSLKIPRMAAAIVGLRARIRELEARAEAGVALTDEMVVAAFVRLYPGCNPDEMQHYHAAEIRAALTAALTGGASDGA